VNPCAVDVYIDLFETGKEILTGHACPGARAAQQGLGSNGNS
jgi:hypothetical protein